MSTPQTKPLLTWILRISGVLTLFTFLHFVAYHKIYVNTGAILRAAIEDQLLFARTEAYQTMPYSESTNEYNFCNLKTFNQDDTQGL